MARQCSKAEPRCIGQEFGTNENGWNEHCCGQIHPPWDDDLIHEQDRRSADKNLIRHAQIEAATEIYGERQPEKEVKAFGTFFNPYRTLMYAIAHRPSHMDTWNKRRRARGMPGKK